MGLFSSWKAGRERRQKEWEDAHDAKYPQPPSVVGQTISFQINEDIDKDHIVIVSNTDGIKLWRKYFKAFAG